MTGSRQAGDVVLEVSDLHVTFPSEAGPVRAVRGLSLDVRAGETLAVVGESGAGKSATSLAVMGLLPRTARVTGSVTLRGVELVGRSDEELSRVRGKDLAMVFQDPLSALTPVYTVGDQIAEAVRAHHDVSRVAARRRAVELLDLVGVPHPELRVASFPHELSGGMRQRAMIAQAIANDPAVILADEPTSALDVTVQAQVLDVLRTAQRETGAGLVLVTHDLGVVAGMADRVVVVYAGRAVEKGTADDIFHRPRMPYTIGLLGAVPRLDTPPTAPLAAVPGAPPSLIDLPPGCPFEPRCPLASAACREAEPDLAGVDADHAAACWHSDQVGTQRLTSADLYARDASVRRTNRPPRSERPVVLQLDGVAQHYPLLAGTVLRRRVGTVRAVDGVDLDLRRGETLGLVGESGCGKTTTLRAILDLRAPTRGRVVVLGKDTATLTRADRLRLRRDLQVVFQDPEASLDPRMPVFDIVAEPLGVHGWRRSRTEERVTELLRLVGLADDHANRYPAHLSGGQRQRVAIARALALEPQVVVLDEPVSALDVSIRAGVVNLLAELSARLDLSYLVVAHDLAVVRHLADRVAVMYLGRVVEVGDVTELYRRPTHPYTQALLSAVPVPDPAVERDRARVLLRGEAPSPANPPTGCVFRTRCPLYEAMPAALRAPCQETMPALRPAPDEDPSGAVAPGTRSVRSTGLTRDHDVACHYAAAAKTL